MKPGPLDPTAHRTPWIDMVKGLACAAIVWHHLASYGPMSDIAYPLAPALLTCLHDYGRMAVPVFLVLGGYLAAASLAPQGVARFDHAGRALAQRLVRLLVPYAVALLLAVLAAALVRPWMAHPSVPEPPTLAQLLANALLLQDILGEEALSAGVWYVAIDFQLFALSVLVLAGARALPGAWAQRYPAAVAQVLIAAGTAASLWVFNRIAGLDVWAPYFAGAYGLGMQACWAVHAPRARGWLAAIVLLAGAALALDYRSRVAVALVTALCLVLAMRSRRVQSWRGIAALVRLGRMSYSVFLLHFSVSLFVSAVFSRWWPTSAALNALGMLLAFVLSLAAGRILYLRVERRAPSWPTALRWQLGLLGVGLLVAKSASWA
ncbi:acyltransferase [Verminephrobacter aporrectodeae subsp. tuberculatae]|uniref:acyltransferase family protein n=1 Tax=Verminephrobacter aporrectodeae TaxID=1110389 RepID=UPI0022380B25|nr:acyltransferase [Verminephrobacter aporrectodeae]MCW5221289.1 acyltransferase [Verminephrobacter aporrectodeae subsp. tuberculatae]MCW5290580.1 acyltransferase [Verminephrobacter aporrectodeae subsp. tuberculatae]MCW8208542.1 acyltransferase [Verminephrobacter aporrectodeae subsp. tuberculatae]